MCCSLAVGLFQGIAMRNPEQQFRDALSLRGIIPPDELQADGNIHRCDVDVRNGEGDASYLFFSDGVPAGGFQNWRDGIGWETWTANSGRRLSAVERVAQSERIESSKRLAKVEAEKTRLKARDKAEAVWRVTKVPADDHPYLVKKGIKAHGLRQFKSALVVPVWHNGVFHSVQFIHADGTKRFLSGGALLDCYYLIGNFGNTQLTATADDTLCVVEGFATGASVRETTGHTVAIAFDAGRLLTVAKKVRGRWPKVRIVLCADDDHKTEGNPGVDKATTAALAVGGLIAVPIFGEGRPDDATDFNDLHRLRGPEAVVACIRNARSPTLSINQTSEQKPQSPVLTTDDWPEPLQLPDGLPPVAAFDFAFLPCTLRPWAQDICDRMQCPPDYVAVTIMAALGSVIGRKIAIRPQQRTDWTVIANQWVLIIGRPGVLKSPAMEAALAPLKRLASRAAESFQVASQDFELASRVAKIHAEAGEKAARTAIAKDSDADVSQLLRAASPEPPTMRRYIANDTTAAALGELLLRNPNGTLVFRDELVSLLSTLDREDNAEARGFYLTGWNGDSPYTIDRIGRGMNLHIPALCISLIGSTQPSRIAGYVHAAIKGGAGDDGLIQRFGLTVFPDPATEWKNVDRDPDSAARRKADDVFEYLDTFDPEDAGAREDEFGGPPFLRFDNEAGALFLEWRAKLEKRLRAGELHLAVESHLAKYRKLVPSMALILHLAERKKGAIRKQTILQALGFADYLETHAMRLYASAINQEVPAAKAIIGKLRGGHLPMTFSRKDVWRNNWTGLSDPKTVGAALQLLADYDWLDVTTIKTRGPDATVYIANPRAI
jgi:putative DNA primase/helicase